MSEKVWADLRRGLQLVRKITDELWKVCNRPIETAGYF